MPKYTFAMSLTDDRQAITRAMELWEQGTLEPVTHPSEGDGAASFPFTTEGVRKAWEVVESHHPHGKVVTDITKR
jgi:hypothetical protein